MTEEEIWMSYLTGAQAAKSMAPSAPSGPIVGRFLSVLAKKAGEFWTRHKATLIPVLTNLAIAALDALVANMASIEAVNNPGPD